MTSPGQYLDALFPAEPPKTERQFWQRMQRRHELIIGAFGLLFLSGIAKIVYLLLSQ